MKCAAFLALCLLTIPIRADEPVGIRFFTGSWNDMLAEANRQNKPVFVDFYTTWCPPCRRMAREAFPNPSVGEKFNTRFVNYQLNAEYGEGADLAKRYTVASYPTALYLTPNGEVVHRSVGYSGITAMIQQANLVLAMPKLRRSISKRNRPKLDNWPLPTLLRQSAQTDSTKTDSPH